MTIRSCAGSAGLHPLYAPQITGNLDAANIFAKAQIGASVFGGSGREFSLPDRRYAGTQ